MAWARRRSLALGAVLVLVLLAFWQEPGLIIPDTKLDLVVDPVGFLTRSRDLWDPTASFGQLPNQAVGYWFPMGPFFVVGDLLAIPAWIVQRLWIAGLLAISFWGMLRVGEALDIGSRVSRVVGALVYALSPTLLMLVAYRSGSQLPTALLPWTLLPLVSGAAGASPRRSAGLSALAVAFMGGVNGAATFLVLAVPAVYLLTREPGPQRRRLMLWWAPLVLAVSLWWIGPLLLQQRYGIPFLELTEQARATTAKTSLVEVLRGAAYWESGLIVETFPWLPAGIRFAVNEVTVLGTALVAAVGLVGLSLRGLRERRFLFLTLMLGVGLMAAGWGGPAGGPVDGRVRELLDGPLAPMRNVHKLAPLVVVPVALGVAHAVARGWQWWYTRARTPEPLRRGLAGVAVVGVLAAASLPLLLGEIAAPGAYEELPEYWRDAADYIDDQGAGGRTLLVPGATWAEYEWGRTLDEPLQPLARDPWAVRNLVPFGGLGQVRLLDAIEETFEDGRASSGLATVLRRSGVEWLLVRNDLDPERATPSSPLQVRRVIERTPGLTPDATFGPVISDPLSAVRLAPQLTPSPPLRALELYRVDGPTASASIAAVDATTVVTGGPESTLTLAEAGVVGDEAIVLTQDLEELGAEGARWVMTDDLRRRNVFPGRVHDAASYTLTADEPSPDGDPDDPQPPTDRLLDAGPEDLAVARDGEEGEALVRASSYLTGYARLPGSGAPAALDGSTATSWRPGALREPVGEWWEMTFAEATPVGPLTVQRSPSTETGSRITALELSTDHGRRRLRFPPGSDTVSVPVVEDTRHLRLTIVGADLSFYDFTTPGLAEVDLGRTDLTRTVVLPTVVPGGDGDRAPDALALSREAADPFDAFTEDEERAIDRTFTLGRPVAYRAEGTATAATGDALEDLLGDLGLDGPIVASSTWRALPGFRAENVIDGDPASAWMAEADDRDPSLTLDLGGRRRVTGITITGAAAPAARLGRITVSGAGGTRMGRADTLRAMRPLVTDRLHIEFPDRVGDREAPPVLVGVAEIQVRSGAGDITPMAPGTNDTVRLPCGAGPEVRVDDRVLPTKVVGSASALLASRPLRFETCQAVRLDRGPHRVQTADAGGFRVETLVLSAPDRVDVGEQRELEVSTWASEERSVVVGPGSTAILMVDENRNDGWRATLGDEELTPVTVDGWRQGFVVPDGPGGEVVLRFTPGSQYDRSIQVGLAAAALALALLLVPSAGAGHRTGPRGLPRWFVLAVGVLVIALVAGWAALFVPALAVLDRRWSDGRLLPRLIGVATLVAGGLAAVRFWPPAAELVDRVRPVQLSQLLLALAIAGLCVVTARTAARPATDAPG